MKKVLQYLLVAGFAVTGFNGGVMATDADMLATSTTTVPGSTSTEVTDHAEVKENSYQIAIKAGLKPGFPYWKTGVVTALAIGSWITTLVSTIIKNNRKKRANGRRLVTRNVGDEIVATFAKYGIKISTVLSIMATWGMAHNVLDGKKFLNHTELSSLQEGKSKLAAGTGNVFKFLGRYVFWADSFNQTDIKFANAEKGINAENVATLWPKKAAPYARLLNKRDNDKDAQKQRFDAIALEKRIKPAEASASA